MDRHKWMSRLAVLLAVMVVLVHGVGLTRAEGPVEVGIPNQPEGPAGLASPDADPHSFLAIGVQYEDVSTTQDAGAVNVIYSSNAALTADGDQIWYEGYDGLPGAPEETDYLGKALAVGDFDGDGNLDLAIGVPYEDYNVIPDAGIVRVLYGANSTLTSTGTQMWYQGFSSIMDDVEADDHFGSALAVGDFDGDGYEDLAIGVPGEQVGDDDNAGVVNVIYGSATGLTDAGNQLWSQGSGDILGLVEAEDWFGYSLAAADCDGDGYDDLAVGVPYEDQNGDAPGAPIIEDAGGVNVIYGWAAGLTDADNWWASQNLADIPGSGHTDDLFGWSLVAGDFDGDHYADLAIGVPYEDGQYHNTGIVHALYGSATGLTVQDNQIWSQNSTGLDDEPEENDRFGYSLTAGDFDRDGHDD